MPNRTEDVASFRRWWYTPDIRSSRRQSPSSTSCRSIGFFALNGAFFGWPGRLQEYWLPPEIHFPRTKGETTLRIVGIPLLISFSAQWSVRPIAPACHHTFSVQCSTKNGPTRWTRYPSGRFSPGCPPPYDHLDSGSLEHAGLRAQIPLRLRLTVEALYSQPPLFSNLPGAVSTLVLIARSTQCVPGQVQDSCRVADTVKVLSPTLNRVRRSGHLHIRCLRSTAPALAVPCSPMPMVTSVSQMAAYQVCSHPASVCLVDHVLHVICPDVLDAYWYAPGPWLLKYAPWGRACGLSNPFL